MNFKELVSKIEGSKIYLYGNNFSLLFSKYDCRIKIGNKILEIINESFVFSIHDDLHFYKYDENEFMSCYQDEENLGYIVVCYKDGLF